MATQNSKKALEKLEKSPQWENKRQRNGKRGVLRDSQAGGQESTGGRGPPGSQHSGRHEARVSARPPCHLQTRAAACRIYTEEDTGHKQRHGSGHIDRHLDIESQLNGVFQTPQENDFYPRILHSAKLSTKHEHTMFQHHVRQSLSHVRLHDPVDCSPPSSSVQGILQARVLAWVAISLEAFKKKKNYFLESCC